MRNSSCDGGYHNWPSTTNHCQQTYSEIPSCHTNVPIQCMERSNKLLALLDDWKWIGKSDVAFKSKAKKQPARVYGAAIIHQLSRKSGCNSKFINNLLASKKKKVPKGVIETRNQRAFEIHDQDIPFTMPSIYEQQVEKAEDSTGHKFLQDFVDNAQMHSGRQVKAENLRMSDKHKQHNKQGRQVEKQQKEAISTLVYPYNGQTKADQAVRSDLTGHTFLQEFVDSAQMHNGQQVKAKKLRISVSADKHEQHKKQKSKVEKQNEAICTQVYPYNGQSKADQAVRSDSTGRKVLKDFVDSAQMPNGRQVKAEKLRKSVNADKHKQHKKHKKQKNRRPTIIEQQNVAHKPKEEMNQFTERKELKASTKEPRTLKRAAKERPALTKKPARKEQTTTNEIASVKKENVEGRKSLLVIHSKYAADAATANTTAAAPNASKKKKAKKAAAKKRSSNNSQKSVSSKDDSKNSKLEAHTGKTQTVVSKVSVQTKEKEDVPRKSLVFKHEENVDTPIINEYRPSLYNPVDAFVLKSIKNRPTPSVSSSSRNVEPASPAKYAHTKFAQKVFSTFASINPDQRSFAIERHAPGKLNEEIPEFTAAQYGLARHSTYFPANVPPMPDSNKLQENLEANPALREVLFKLPQAGGSVVVGRETREASQFIMPSNIRKYSDNYSRGSTSGSMRIRSSNLIFPL